MSCAENPVSSVLYRELEEYAAENGLDFETCLDEAIETYLSVTVTAREDAAAEATRGIHIIRSTVPPLCPNTVCVCSRTKPA